MKTEIIKKEGTVIVAKYDFFIPMSKGDIVDIFGFEYIVDFCCLNVHENKFEIFVN
jgi:hypothetical protein